MLQSQKEERERRFTLALRAGIPVLLLVFLVLYASFYKGDVPSITLQEWILLIGIIFVTIYFIYFLMNLSVQETLLDQTTQGYNKKSFIKKLQQFEATSIACLNIKNLSLLNENYSSDQIDNLLYSITSKLHQLFKQNGFNQTLIGRGRGSEVLIAVNKKEHDIKYILESMIKENQSINDIAINYAFAVVTNTDGDFQKAILQLRDIIASQFVSDDAQQDISNIQDTKELSEIENYVILAIKNKDLLLSFRPLLNTHTNHIDTYEIAIKLRCYTQKNDILPRIFLPIVNRLGLGREYDLALLKHVVNLLPLVNNNISFTFNLSPFSLRDTNFQTKVFEYLTLNKVDPSRLIIQLYERKTHHDLSAYLQTLKKFRAQGLRICIDNFGSSNASMKYMKHFKFDMIQFDREYVTQLEDKTTYSMLQSLITMSKELGVKSVAKWVDNKTQEEKLKTLGIDYLQGFGIGKPLTEDTLINQYN